jgi:murein DD-endopeptidase MepM/ murein hydrolase activator NlpD
MKLELFYPVKPKVILQGFGANKDYYQKNVDPRLQGHPGIDFEALHGQPVYAAHDGVCYPEIDSKGGNGVVIRTTQSFDYNGGQSYYKSIYWHLIQDDAVVKTGDSVKAGDLIGYADSTGISTGDHLHFGLKPQLWNEQNWTWDNPEQQNGFLGNIDSMSCFNGYFAENAQEVLGNLQTQVSLYSKVVELLKKLIGLK